ncbi:MAG: hypothetical protein K1X88_22575 [Nannocystaceae bacterium]|nr:hypothetical protein [Nannocystaceae bacterium]
MSKPRYCLRVCDGPSCGVMHGSERLVALAERIIAREPGLAGTTVVRNYTCFGRCDDGPNMFVQPLGPGDDPDRDPEFEVLERERGFYPGMDETKLERVLTQHCGRGEVVDDLVDDY